MIFSWIDPHNLNQVIRPWYAKALPFPLNFYYPGKYEKYAKSMIQALYPTKDDKAAEISVSIFFFSYTCIR